jgi:hypothetical protein
VVTGGGGGGDGSPIVSAIPADLIGYSRAGVLHSETLIGTGRSLQAAIDVLNQSIVDPTYLPQVPDLGGQLQRYANAKYQIDEWVGRVGDAFWQANRGQPATAPVWATQDEIAQALSQDTSQNAQNLARQFQQALKSGNQQELQQLLLELDAHQDDPDYNAAFFKALGPYFTLWTVSEIDSSPGELQTFDSALASGTNSLNWDESFTTQLLNPQQPVTDQLPVPYQHTLVGELLQFGSYSSDFLNHAGHYLLDDTLYTSTSAGISFLNALIRCTDPNFAYEWLTHVQDGIPWVAGALQMMFFADPGVQKALASVIAFSGNPASDPTDQKRLGLYAALSLASTAYIGSSIRQALANLMASDIGDFREFDGKVPYSEAKVLIQLAELDQDGNPIPADIRVLQDALKNWLVQNAPTTDDEAKVATYFRDIGTLFALWALPQRDHAYFQAAGANTQSGWEFFGISVALSIVQAVPVVGQVLGVVGNTAVGDIAGYILGQAQNGVNSGVASQLDQQLRQLYIQTSASARMSALLEFVSIDPNVVPPMVRHMGSAAVKQYLGELAASQDPAHIQVDGKYVFAGQNPPGFEDAMTAYEHLQNLQQQIDNDFLEWAHP